ncbi:MAG: malate synthase G [Granulosicoccus sp.]
MTSRQSGGLTIATELHDFIVNEALSDTGIEAENFFKQFADILAELAPRNRTLLAFRDELQEKIDAWHRAKPGPVDQDKYMAFLLDIGYLLPTVDDFKVSVDHVDPEIAQIASPQLVVPVSNARFALNAANARWGSLYDALYGTDAISEAGGATRAGSYNPVRGERVVAYASQMLDDVVPLGHGSWGEVTTIQISGGKLQLILKSGSEIGLANPTQCIGFKGETAQPNAVLLINNGLHLELQIDPTHYVGTSSSAGIKDILMESALSTVQDCEDSVAAVDAADKVVVYRNWLGLMKGDLEVRFSKDDKEVVRTLNSDREYQSLDGTLFSLPGKSVQLVRNVGSHMLTDVILDQDDQQVPETFIDAMVTGLCALHDLNKSDREVRNSRTGSVYIVKPKQHGPDEVTLSVELFARVEEALGMPANTLKIGIMDEERRTTVNLKNCIAAARERVIFINTGFLDRTGDELHTNMLAGIMVPKGEMKDARWLDAYEDNNVDVGLACGMAGNGQIGKGMWAIPDQMAAMIATKQAHPEAGANCAWVPSPTAATLHAMHYHNVDVQACQAEIAKRESAKTLDILSIPLVAPGRNFSSNEIQQELDNNSQSILGYVVRWVNQGIGCSKVPDINNVGLMEDRATLRISSQALANWLQHEIIDEAQVRDAMERMAIVVDQQNAADTAYVAMAPDFDKSIAFQAALDLVLKGRQQASGYTEFILTTRRREAKAAQLAS